VLFSATTSLAQLAAAGPDREFAERFDLPRDPDEVLRDVLSRREFAEDPASRLLRRILDKALFILDKILRWILGRIPSMGKMEFSGDVLGTIGTALLVGVAAAILVMIGWKLGVLLARRSWKRAVGRAPDLEPEDAQSPADLRALALREADHENFGRAVVLFFRYAILRLDEEGLLAYHPGKTNRELLAALTADDAIRRSVGEMARLFNRVRYGGTTCGRNDYDRFLTLCRDVVGGV